MTQTAITLAFEAYLAEQQLGGQPVVLDEIVLAHIPGLDLSQPINRAVGLPDASQIVHRQKVDQRGKINANGVAYSIVMDTNLGDFTFNAMYLIHKASGLVAMVVHKAEEDKLKNLLNRPGNSLVKSMLMEYQGAAEATLTHVDAGTWQIDFTARLMGLDKDIQQQALDHYGDAAFIADGFAVRPGTGVNEFLVTPGMGYIAGLRTELTSSQSVTVAQRPAVLYADVYHAGTLLSDWHTLVTIRASTTPLSDYVDEAGYPHYVTPLASLASNGTVTDLRGRGGLWWHEHRPDAHTKDQVGLDKLENWSWSHSYTDAAGGATKYATSKAVADAYNKLNSIKLNASQYTAADVLAKMLTVDGIGSKLDTEFLGGKPRDWVRHWDNLLGKPATFPPSAHHHDDRYYTKAQGNARYASIVHDIKNATHLGTSHLDTITDHGVFYQPMNANATAARKYPAQYAGTLIVTEAAGVVQTYIPYHGYSAIIYTRGFYSGSWSEWSATYSTNHKPSKADVGLGSVPNYPATSSVSDASNSKFATAGAVKSANDNANGRLPKNGKAVDSANLNGATDSTGEEPNTIAKRNTSGDIQARLFRSSYGASNTNVKYIMTQVDQGSNNFIRPTTPAHFRAAVTDPHYAPKSHKHHWDQVTNKPATALRWPKWGEITEKPSLGSQLIAEVRSGSSEAYSGNGMYTEKRSNYLKHDFTPEEGATYQITAKICVGYATSSNGLRDIDFYTWLDVSGSQLDRTTEDLLSEQGEGRTLNLTYTGPITPDVDGVARVRIGFKCGGGDNPGNFVDLVLWGINVTDPHTWSPYQSGNRTTTKSVLTIVKL
ncbi:phage tail protein [Oceanimonas baumannii]|nr:phage tail protein [Oceanimonas baumannii]TDW59429.1 tail-collar fiber protein [Oceanimonas baumannii]